MSDGLVFVLGAWACFGTFAVPMKISSVRGVGIDPVIFQSYKTFWTFVTSWLVLLWHDFEFSWWGLASGFCWVPAGVAAVVAVKHVGIAVGQMTWQVLIIVVSFAWGAILGEQVASIWLTTLAVSLLVLGLLGMTLAFNIQRMACVAQTVEKLPPPCCIPGPSRYQNGADPLLQPPAAGQAAIDVIRFPAPDSDWSKSSFIRQISPYVGRTQPERESEQPAELDVPSSVSRASPAVGFAAAIFNGLWGGSNLVPMHFAPSSGISFVVSFAVGSCIVNATLLCIYAGVLRSRHKEFPGWHLRVMFWPGFCCGVLWSAGNMFSVYAVQALGQAIGYSCVQASVLVSGCWGIFFYHELTREASGVWLLSALFSMAGVALLSQQRVP